MKKMQILIYIIECVIIIANGDIDFIENKIFSKYITENENHNEIIYNNNKTDKNKLFNLILDNNCTNNSNLKDLILNLERYNNNSIKVFKIISNKLADVLTNNKINSSLPFGSKKFQYEDFLNNGKLSNLENNTYNLSMEKLFSEKREKTNKNLINTNLRIKRIKHLQVLIPIIHVEENLSNNLNFTCINNSSCNYHGKCLNNTFCECDPFFTTFYIKDSMKFNFTQCNYKQLSKNSLFTLSFFLGPLAFEHILMGNLIIGLIKLVLPMILILIGNSLFMLGKLKNNNKLQIFGKVFELVATIIITLWWFIDWILILSGFYKDNKNVDLFNDF